jgi:hypothetical protein
MKKVYVFVTDAPECDVVKAYSHFLIKKMPKDVEIKIVDVRKKDGIELMKKEGFEIEYVPTIISFSFENCVGHAKCIEFLKKLEEDLGGDKNR